MILVGGKTIILAKNKKIQSVLSIEGNCYIDATSSGGIVFGKNVSIGKNTNIECAGSLTNLGIGLILGDDVGLGASCFYGCAGGITIGDDTIFGNFISLHSENYNYERKDIPIRLQGVNRQGIKIGKDCWIGAKATILDGVVIGANSLVDPDLANSNSIYVGNPVRLIKENIKWNI